MGHASSSATPTPMTTDATPATKPDDSGPKVSRAARVVMLWLEISSGVSGAASTAMSENSKMPLPIHSSCDQLGPSRVKVQRSTDASLCTVPGAPRDRSVAHGAAESGSRSSSAAESAAASPSVSCTSRACSVEPNLTVEPLTSTLPSTVSHPPKRPRRHWTAPSSKRSSSSGPSGSRSSSKVSHSATLGAEKAASSRMNSPKAKVSSTSRSTVPSISPTPTKVLKMPKVIAGVIQSDATTPRRRPDHSNGRPSLEYSVFDTTPTAP